MLFVYLLACRNILILEEVHFRFIEVNFPCMGEGNRKKLSFPSTVTTSCPNFVPKDTHSLRHKLKTSYSFACSSQMPWWLEGLTHLVNVNCTYLHIFNERGMSHSFDSNWPTSEQGEKFVGACLKPKLTTNQRIIDFKIFEWKSWQKFHFIAAL